MKTKYLPIKYWEMVEGKFPNAGPNPNIRGMKEKYYGKNAMTVMCKRYLYHLTGEEGRKIYNLAK